VGVGVLATGVDVISGSFLGGSDGEGPGENIFVKFGFWMKINHPQTDKMTIVNRIEMNLLNSQVPLTR